MKPATKLPKPSKVNRKLTLSKETIAQLNVGEAPGRPKCTGFHTGCLPYTC
jgi:hypothetical protein